MIKEQAEWVKNKINLNITDSQDLEALKEDLKCPKCGIVPRNMDCSCVDFYEYNDDDTKNKLRDFRGESNL